MMLKSVLAVVLALQAAVAVRPGAVVGQLQTKEGTPAVAIRITAVPAPPPNIRPSDGQNYYASDRNLPVSTAFTDSQGRYRLQNLAPGRYFIVARVFGYPTYYPATTNADGATVVTVDAAPVEGIDFTVIMPPGGNVRGRVDPPPTAPEQAIISGVTLGELLETPVAKDGTFNFGHLPNGTYLVSLFPTPPGMASKIVQVNGADTRADLARPTVRTVSGRVVAPPAVIRRVLIGFSTDRSYVTATAKADGSFTALLQPDRHRIELGGLPPGYTLGSARLDNQDVSQGVPVGAQNISGLVINVAPPPGK